MENKFVFSVEELLKMQRDDDTFMLEESSLCSLCSYTCSGGTKIEENLS